MLKQFSIDRSNPEAPERQFLLQLESLREAGLLQHRGQLPSVRELAIRLGVAPYLVEEALRTWERQDLSALLGPPVRQALALGYSPDQIEAAVRSLTGS